MIKPRQPRTFLPLILIFVVINSLSIIFKNRLAAKGVDPEVILIANLILFVVTVLTTFMHTRALKNSNPNVFVRSVMGSAIIKLFIIAGTVLIYLYLAGESRSIAAIIISMGLYVIYTVFEIQSVSRLNRKNNGS